MKIRKASVKDLDVLTELWYEEEKLHNRFGKHAKMRKNAKKLIYNFLKSNIKKPYYSAFIAEDKGKAIGALNGQIKKWHFVEDVGLYGYCSTIFVKESYRNKGVAKRLFNQMNLWFKSKKIKVTALFVHSKNKSALKVWKNLGFKEVLKWMIREI